MRFPELGAGSALGTGCAISFPRLAHIERFPALETGCAILLSTLGTCCMFSRALRRLHVVALQSGAFCSLRAWECRSEVIVLV